MKIIDWVSILYLIATILLFVAHLFLGWNVSFFLLIVIGFTFHGIMWNRQYIERIRYLEEENEFLTKELKEK